VYWYCFIRNLTEEIHPTDVIGRFALWNAGTRGDEATAWNVTDETPPKSGVTERSCVRVGKGRQPRSRKDTERGRTGEMLETGSRGRVVWMPCPKARRAVFARRRVPAATPWAGCPTRNPNPESVSLPLHASGHTGPCEHASSILLHTRPQRNQHRRARPPPPSATRPLESAVNYRDWRKAERLRSKRRD